MCIRDRNIYALHKPFFLEEAGPAERRLDFVEATFRLVRSALIVVRLNIGEVTLGGYLERNVRIWIDASQLDARNVTVSEVIVAFFEHARRYYLKNPKTAENFKPILTLVRQLYGRTQADEFGPKALKAIRERLVADGQSRNYVNDNIQRIKRMYRWATAEQLVSPHVMQGLNALAGLRKGYTNARETAPVMPVDDATVEATHPYLPPVVQAMVRLQRLTGARPAEICAIRPRDIERTGEVWKFTPRNHLSLIHISEPTRPYYISSAVFCLKKKHFNFY